MTKQQTSKIAKTLYKTFQSIFQDDGIDSCSWDITNGGNSIIICINDRIFDIKITERIPENMTELM